MARFIKATNELKRRESKVIAFGARRWVFLLKDPCWAEVAFFENAKKWIDIVSMVFDLTSRKKI